jgi:hypothetical protein
MDASTEAQAANAGHTMPSPLTGIPSTQPRREEQVIDEGKEDNGTQGSNPQAGESDTLAPGGGIAVGHDLSGHPFTIKYGQGVTPVWATATDKVDHLTQQLLKSVEDPHSEDVPDTIGLKLAEMAQVHLADITVKSGGEGAPTIDADKEAEAMWESLKKRGFRFGTDGAKGNPIAGRWSRDLRNDPELKKKYMAVKGSERKAQMRQEWCKLKFDDYQKTKSYTQRSEIVDTSKGQYLSLLRMAHKEGGGQSSLMSSIRYALKCISLGPPWIRWDSMTDTMRYLYMVLGYEENFTRACARANYRASAKHPSYTHRYIHTHMHIHIQIHIYTYIDTYMHIYKRICECI